MFRIETTKRARNVIANFDIRDENSYDKRVRAQINKVFSKEAAIACCFMTIPIFPIAWPVIYAIYRLVHEGAKVEVASALAHEKLSIISSLAKNLPDSESQVGGDYVARFLGSQPDVERFFKDEEK